MGGRPGQSRAARPEASPPKGRTQQVSARQTQGLTAVPSGLGPGITLDTCSGHPVRSELNFGGQFRRDIRAATIRNSLPRGFTVCSDEIQWRSQEEPVSRAEQPMACPNPLPDLTTAEITRDAVRRILHQRSTDCPPSEVIDRVSGDLHVSRASVKAAIWELYADGFLELTPNWDLRETSQAVSA